MLAIYLLLPLYLPLFTIPSSSSNLADRATYSLTARQYATTSRRASLCPRDIGFNKSACRLPSAKSNNPVNRAEQTCTRWESCSSRAARNAPPDIHLYTVLTDTPAVRAAVPTLSPDRRAASAFACLGLIANLSCAMLRHYRHLRGAERKVSRPGRWAREFKTAPRRYDIAGPTQDSTSRQDVLPEETAQAIASPTRALHGTR